MRRSRIVVGGCLLALAILLTVAGIGAGDSRDPIRIGVLTDCAGLLAQSHQPVLAGAALPLVERGGTRHDDGSVSGAEVRGRPIELVPACTEFTYLHVLTFATRRLIEEDGVDLVLGPIGGPEGVVFRDLARHYPDVTFIEGPSLPQEATLRDPQPNLFRFTPDGAQITAGLGTYAYRELGWRRAVVVGEPFSDGWELAAGFAAEFCALGGGVVERDWQSLLVPDPSAAARRHARTADGVVVLSSIAPVAFLAAYVREVGALSTRTLLAGPAFLDPRNLSSPGVDLEGVVLGGYIPLDPGMGSMRDFLSRLERVFPELPPGPAKASAVMPVYTAMRAVLTALDETGGELGDHQRELRAALSSLELAVPQGTIRLDRNRQAVAPIYLQRIARRPGGTLELETVRTIRDVEQTYGGIFTATTPRPSPTEPACQRRRPPAWAQ
jgi:branched-chain amino acid transport system substrate-binding protein